MTARTRKDFSDGDILPASDLDYLPGGFLAYGHAVANQLGITTEDDLTNMAETVTVDTLRLVLIIVTARINVTDSGSKVLGWIYRDSSRLNRWCSYTAGLNDDQRKVTGIAWDTPGAGTYDYKATLQLNAGTGSAQLLADADDEAQFVIIELGAR